MSNQIAISLQRLAAMVERLVDRILTPRQREAGADTSALERGIDQLVYALYSLTPEEIQIVESTAN